MKEMEGSERVEVEEIGTEEVMVGRTEATVK